MADWDSDGAIMAVAQALPRALEDGALAVHYQPILCARTRRPVALEALARWSDPDLGTIPSGTFIPIAERLGLIDRLGTQMRERAFAQLAQWTQERRPVLSTLAVAANASMAEVMANDFAPRLLATLRTLDLAPPRIIVEVTESIPAGPALAAIRYNLEALRARGVAIALDDFGTGHADLTAVAALPLDEVKLDRTLIQGPADNFHASVGAIRQCRPALLLVAEGIETADQATRAQAAGCAWLQGHLFAAAMAPADLHAWFAVS